MLTYGEKEEGRRREREEGRGENRGRRREGRIGSFTAHFRVEEKIMRARDYLRDACASISGFPFHIVTNKGFLFVEFFTFSRTWIQRIMTLHHDSICCHANKFQHTEKSKEKHRNIWPGYVEEEKGHIHGSDLNIKQKNFSPEDQLQI